MTTIERDVRSRLSDEVVVRLPGTSIFRSIVRELAGADRRHGPGFARVRSSFVAASHRPGDEIVASMPNTGLIRNALRELALVAFQRSHGHHGCEWQRLHDELELAVDADRLEDVPPIDALEER